MSTPTPAPAPAAAPPAPPGSGRGRNRVLEKMLDRLFAGLLNGPGLTCRPHASRQRIDLTALAKLQDGPPEDLLRELLGAERQVKATARVKAPKGRKPSRRRWGAEAAAPEPADVAVVGDE